MPDPLPDFTVDEDLQAWMVAIRRHLHRHPEIAYHEFESGAYIQRKLGELGFVSSVGHGATGVVAVLGSRDRRSPCVGLRADMDALPLRERTALPFRSVNDGVMHACGHDGHMAMLLGAAALLRERSLPEGRVKLIFQPAEEHGNGAARLVEEGIVDDLEAIFAAHIDTHFSTGQITVDEGIICAFSDPFHITINGRGGHAARPHEGTDAVVAASSLVMIIQTLVSREVDPNKAEVITIGSFHAGEVHNVMAGRAELKGTIRSTDESTRERTIGGLRRVVQSIESMYGVRVEIRFETGLPAVINAPRATEAARMAAWDVTGPDKVVSQGYPSLGSEDFSFYQERVDGCLVRIGSTPPEGAGPAHSDTFDFDESCLGVGAAWLAAVAWRWLYRPTPVRLDVNGRQAG